MARRNKNNPPNQGQEPDVNYEERLHQAILLRRIGYDYETIAKRCGYASKSTAFDAIKRARQKALKEDTQALVMVQAEQINAALVIVNERIARNDKESLWAVDRLVPLLKRQAELLGLDAKSEIPQGATLVREIGAEVDKV